MSDKRTILVVDDMPIFRDPIAASLRLAGYDTVCASNGAEALGAARARRPDLILLDVAMPVMDGLSFLRAARNDKHLAGVPVVLLTAVSDKGHVIEAGKLGIKEYLLKSRFSLADLLGRVKKSLPPAPPDAAAPPPAAAAHPSAPRSPHLIGAASTASTANATPAVASGQTHTAPTGLSPLTRDQSLARAEKALQLKTLSGVVAQVIAEAASPHGNVAELAHLIARDPMLSARVLQAANSAAYRSHRPVVSTIPDAVRNVGSTTVRNIAAALGIFDAMPPSEPDGFNPIRCWQHSFAVATLCERLAGGREDGGVAYLVGLCHDLGEILFHTHFAAEYRQALADPANAGKPRAELVRLVLGMSLGELVAKVLQCLKLPDVVRLPIERFHADGSPGRAAEEPLTQILRLADVYANGLLLASSPQSPVRPLTQAECRAASGADAPARPEVGEMRSRILGMTGMLARLSPQEEAELMKPLYDLRPVRVWLARDPALSAFDPVAAALQSVADADAHDRLPYSAEELGDCRLLVVAARTDQTPCLTGPDIARAARLGGDKGDKGDKPLHVLWLVGQCGTPAATAAATGKGPPVTPVRWPVPLERLAAFAAEAAA